MNKGILIALGIGAAVLLLSKSKNPPCDARLVQLPSGQIVCETVLPGMGYILYTDGKWYHRTQFQPPTTGQYAGQNPNSQQWQNILVGLVNTGFDIFNMFQTSGGAQGEPLGGEPTGGIDPSGMAGITYSPVKSTQWTCRDGRYSNSRTKSGACAYHGGVMHKF